MGAGDIITTKNLKKQMYKMLEIQPLHLDHEGLHIPVLDFQLSQQFSPSYKKEEVYGRMDPILTYSNTKRSVRIGFVCQAHHYIDGTGGVVDNVSLINLLTQMLYPSYENVGKDKKMALLKAPPFFKLKYGQYLGSYEQDGSPGGGLTGVITGFSHNIGKPARNYAYGEASSGRHLVLPREIKCGFSFDVVHDKEVGWRKKGGKYYFSHDGYGSNFPYNTGQKTTPPTPEKPKEGLSPGQKDAAGDKKPAATPKGAGTPAKTAATPAKPVKKTESKVGPHAQAMSAAQTRQLRVQGYDFDVIGTQEEGLIGGKWGYQTTTNT